VFKPNIEAKAIKPLPSDFWDNVDYVIDVSLSAITLKAKGNSSYYGVVVLYYTQPYIKTPQWVVLHNDSGEVVWQDTQNFTRISDTEWHQKVIETHGAKWEVNKEIDFGLLCGDTTNDSRANVLGTTLNNDLVYPVNIFRELYVNPTTTISSVSNEYSKLNAITISNSGVGLYHIDYETYGNTSFYNKFTTINITNNWDPFTAPKDELRINELRYTMPPMTTSPTTALTLYIRNHFTTNDNPVINLNKINLLFNKATVVRQCNLTWYIRLELRKNTTKHIYTPLFNTAIGSMSYGTYVIQFIIEDLDTPHIPNTKEVHWHLKVPTTHITLNQGIVLSALQNQMKLHIHLPTGTDIRMFYNKTPTLLEVVYIYDYN
jgi:hypothetical protein